MRSVRATHVTQRFGLLAAASLLILASFGYGRVSEISRIRQDLRQFREKISPLLLDEVAFTKSHPVYDRKIPVIVQVKKEYFEEDLENRRHSGRSQRNMLKGIRGYTGRLTGRQIESLMASDQVEYVTVDATIRLTGKEPRIRKKFSKAHYPEDILSVIGADQLKAKGRTRVAVFDSGMARLDEISGFGEKVKKSFDFTSGEPVEKKFNWDHYGHGTAVAGLLGGDGEHLDAGIATKPEFYDLKVVGDHGTGSTSNLIRAIDWVTENAEKEKIRVANLSLGHPPMESYRNDPLCQAVERMVAAGVVTVVSAGNLGRTADHPEIWGSITSPGNDPLVITVGAMNTQGTLTHSDDTVASYSSRGPTYLDGLFKPDLVAPGNRILSQATPGSYLAEAYPELMVDSEYLQLSGSSMATAVVSATVALMLEENKDLNPNLVKLILLTTAIKMQQPSMLEQGNGMVNVKTAVELAKEIDVKKQEVKDFVFPNWTLVTEDGPEEVWAGGAFAYGDQIVYGDLVQTDIAGFWGDGVFWTDFLVQPKGVFWTDFFAEGVFWTDSIFKQNGVFWTDAAFWGDALAWTEGVFWTDVPFRFGGVFWTDFFGGNGVFWTDALIVSDGTETDMATGDGD